MAQPFPEVGSGGVRGRADWLFHVYHPTMRTALDVGAGESGASSLASCFDEVWVLGNEESEGHSRVSRAAERGGGNIRFARPVGPGLPFADRSFDVVVLRDGGVHRLDRGLVEEALRVLTHHGVVCLLGHNSMSPLLAMLGSPEGGLTRGQGQARHRRLLTAAGARILRECWVLPSHARPTWSGDLAWAGGLRFVVAGLGRHSIELPQKDRRSRIARRLLLSPGGRKLLRALLPFGARLVPCVVTFASRGAALPCLLDQLATPTAEATGWVIRSAAGASNKLTLFQVDARGTGRRTFYLCRVPYHDEAVEREGVGAGFNGYSQPSGRRIVEGRVVVEAPFYRGAIVSPFDAPAAKRVIDWLLAFQEGRTGSAVPATVFTTVVAERIRPALRPWLERFLRRTNGMTPRASPEHGDFAYSNILIDRDRVSVVDWEFYETNGDQLFDVSTFLWNWYFDAVAAGRVRDLQGFFAWRPVTTLVRRFCEQAQVGVPLLWCYLPIAVARLEFRQRGNGRPEYRHALEEADAIEAAPAGSLV